MEDDKNTAPELSPRDVDGSEELLQKRGCCFWIPCLPSVRNWELISTSENPKEETGTWLSKGVNAFKKVREWSELVAGPKWKTFIRRFNKSRSRTAKFQYDALSYALNFDDGPDHYGDLEEDVAYPDFSSRYAWISVSTKSSSSAAVSMDLGKNATAIA